MSRKPVVPLPLEVCSNWNYGKWKPEIEVQCLLTLWMNKKSYLSRLSPLSPLQRSKVLVLQECVDWWIYSSSLPKNDNYLTTEICLGTGTRLLNLFLGFLRHYFIVSLHITQNSWSTQLRMQNQFPIEECLLQNSLYLPQARCSLK